MSITSDEIHGNYSERTSCRHGVILYGNNCINCMREKEEKERGAIDARELSQKLYPGMYSDSLVSSDRNSGKRAFARKRITEIIGSNKNILIKNDLYHGEPSPEAVIEQRDYLLSLIIRKELDLKRALDTLTINEVDESEYIDFIEAGLK